MPYPPGSDYLRLISSPTTLASGKCFDMILDWSRGAAGHYDARLARSCKAVTQRDTAVSHESPHNLIGINRLGTCYGTNQNTNGAGSVCHFVIGGPAGIPTNVGASQFCIRAWSMTPTGTLQFFSGGDPTSCTS